jgi:hypothetical protein
MRCFSEAIGYQQGSLGPKIMAGPTGLGPAQIQSAYKLTWLASGGKTVALVDAFNDPNAASDLATVEAVSAACPGCHILLVEANSTSTANLERAEDTAAKTPGVVSVSNSWGGSEAASELSGDGHFNHPGVAITASAGDSGYGTSWPAVSPVRHRRRWHDPDASQQLAGLDGEGVVRLRQRLLHLGAQAHVAA